MNRPTRTPSGPWRDRPRLAARQLRLLAAVLTALVLVGACSGSDGTSTSGAGGSAGSESEGAGSRPQPAAEAGGADGAAKDPGTGEVADTGGDQNRDGSGAVNGQPGSGAGGGAGAARVLPEQRDIVYTADLTVRVKDLAAATARAEALALGAAGIVFAEESSSDPDRPGSGSAQLTLKVPPAGFRTLLRDLAALGTRLTQHQTAEDVTAQRVDVESRLASQRASVARVRALLGRATKIGEVVQVEAELARREADLESLEAQRKRLADLTALASVTVTLLGPDTAPLSSEEPARGFLAGVKAGWRAFMDVTATILTVVGGALPFAIVAVLVGLPLWRLLRGRGRRRATTTVPAAAADPLP